MAFFRNMTFPRIVILLSLIGSGVLGYQYQGRAQRLDELKREVDQAPEVAREIQVLALQLQELKRKLGKENLDVLKDPDLYIRQIAQQRNVDIGGVKVDFDEKEPAKGVVDNIQTITPQDKRRGKDRTRIANFLYQLEAGSRRVRVTRFELTPVKSFKPHEIGPDNWAFEAEITSRQRIDAER